ncbi:MAG: gliding motility-associated C-terminal domain-containing protein [Saprospiraceae bacterium]|nr:gliding motility-associated C-terminal domain-containing protein [Saprospiraceae bacterium]
MNKLYIVFSILISIFSINILNAQNPLIKIVNSGKSICKGDTTTLVISVPSNTKIKWSNGSTLSCDTCTTVKSFPLITTTYFIAADSLGKKDTAYLEVKVKDQYIPNIPLQVNFCQNGGATYNLNIANFDPNATISWTKLLGNCTIKNEQTNNISFYPKSPSTWNFTTVLDGCNFNGQFKIDMPVELNIDGNDTLRVCKGDSLKMSVTKRGSFATVNWSPSTGLNNTTGDTVKVFTTKSRWYVAKLNDINCQAVDSVYVTIDSLPEKSLLAIAPADTLVCRGVKVYLRSKLYEPEDYKLIRHKWFPPQNQLTPDSSYLMFIEANDSLPTKYTRITQNGACFDTSFATIRTNPVLFLKLTPDTTICEFGKVQLGVVINPTVKDYEWSPSDGLSCTKCTNPIATPSSTITYQLKAKDGECPVSGKMTIKVDKITYQFPTKTNICEGEQFRLNSQPNNNLKYVWKADDPTFGTQNTADPLVQPLKNTTYYVTITIGNCLKIDSFKVNVTPKQVVTIAKDTIICFGGTATFVATPTGTNGSFVWNPNLSTSNSLSFKPTNNTNISLTYTYGAANCITTATSKVDVINVRNGFVFPTKTDYCLGDKFVTNTNPQGVYSYVWTSTDPSFLTSTQNSVQVTSKINATYYLTIKDLTNRCVEKDSFSVKVFDDVVKTIKDTTVCLLSDITLNTTSNGTGTYKWTSSNNTLNSTEKNPVVKPSENTTYFVKYTYGPSCMKFDTVNIKTLPNINPILTRRLRGKLINQLDTITLGDTVNLIVKLAPPIPNCVFTWTGNGYPSSIVGDSVFVKTLENPTVYNLNVKTPEGCTSTINNISILVQVPDYDFPNVFYPDSPNNPSNRLFDITMKKGLREAITMKTLKIFNRWGELVYNNDNPSAGWDGRYNDNLAPSDVYTYYAEFELADGITKTKKGEVLLLR